MIGYSNHMIEPRSISAKIHNPVRQIPPDVPLGGDFKNSQKDNPKIPDIFFNPSNSPNYCLIREFILRLTATN